jgi:SAM-dependent methyltransferase
MPERSLESRIDYMRGQILAGEFTGPAREVTAVIETAFRELYRRSIGLLAGQDRMRVLKAEEQIGKGTKTFDEFTLGQMVALFRNSNFLEGWAKSTNHELRGIRMINFDEVVRLRNQLVHSSSTATRGEAELLFQCVRSILETFGILSLERVAADVPATQGAPGGKPRPAAGAPRPSAYQPTRPREGNRLGLQARHAHAFDERLLAVARDHVGHEALTVLDIGCADGIGTVDRFADLSYQRVVGVDRDPTVIQAAQKKNPDPDRFTFACLDVEAFDFEVQLAELFSGTPDIVYSALTIHHLANPIKLLRTCRYSLSRPGAVVLRGSDDGSKTAYPDPEDRVQRAIELTLASPGVSDRMNGRRRTVAWLRRSASLGRYERKRVAVASNHSDSSSGPTPVRDSPPDRSVCRSVRATVCALSRRSGNAHPGGRQAESSSRILDPASDGGSRVSFSNRSTMSSTIEMCTISSPDSAVRPAAAGTFTSSQPHARAPASVRSTELCQRRGLAVVP